MNDKKIMSDLENEKINASFEFESPKINLDLNLLTKEEVYEKMHEIVKAREKQIRDLAVMVGSFNQKLHSVMEKNNKLEEENKQLTEKLIKKDVTLNQELSNKEIMFIRLSNVEQENERLLSLLQNNKVQQPQKKGFFSSFFSGTSSKNSNVIEQSIPNSTVPKNEYNCINFRSFVSNSATIVSNNKIENIGNLKIEQNEISSNKIDINININQNTNFTKENAPSQTSQNNNFNPVVSKDPSSKSIGLKSHQLKKKAPQTRQLASDQIDYKPLFG